MLPLLLQLPLNFQEAVVFRDTLSTSRCSALEVTIAKRNGKVRDEGVNRLPGAVGHKGRPMAGVGKASAVK